MTAEAALALALHVALLLLLPPLVLGVIVKTKALVAGRRGPPVLQPYHDVLKLLQKGAVYSRTTTLAFRIGPIGALAATIVAGLVVPLGRNAPPFAFPGDLVLFAYLLGVGRFVTMLAALDTGSSFEGMGASREATFATLAEPALFLAVAVLALAAGNPSLAAIAQAVSPASFASSGPSLLLAVFALFVVTLAENSRVPVDDPATHLELTMIHEVMVLDHSGPDFALILYGAAMKLVVVGSLVVTPLLPRDLGSPWANAGAFLGGAVLLGVAIGVVESTMARLRLARVPILLAGAIILAAIGLVVRLTTRG